MEAQENLPIIEIGKMDTVSRDTLTNQLITALKSGNIDPIEFAVRRKLINDALDEAMKDPDVRDIISAQLALYGKEKPTRLGAEVTVRNTPKYDYSQDDAWRAIKSDCEPFESALKAQEERIKVATKTGGVITDPDTGEILAQPVPVSYTESIVVTFKKSK